MKKGPELLADLIETGLLVLCREELPELEIGAGIVVLDPVADVAVGRE